MVSRPAASGPKLGKEEIVAGALRLARRVGAEHINMRALAAELGASPMSIYHYVPNKDALLGLAIDAVLAEVPLPTPDPRRWQKQLKACALSAFQALERYPGLSRVVLSRASYDTGRAITDYCVSVLLCAGFDERQAALAITAFNTYLFGVYTGLGVTPRVKATRGKAKTRRKVAAIPTGVPAVMRQVDSLEIKRALDFGIDAMLAGIDAQSRVAARKR